MTQEQFDTFKAEVDAVLPTDYVAYYAFVGGNGRFDSLSIVVDTSVASPTPAQLVADQLVILDQIYKSRETCMLSFNLALSMV